MPKVPTYADAPTVNPSAPTGVMESAGVATQMAQFAGRDAQALGGGLMQAGNAYRSYQERLQDEANTADFKARDSGVMRSLDELFHNTDTGYMLTKGAAALDGHADVVGRIDQIAESFANGIEDPRRRQEFMDLARQRATTAIHAANEHAAQQTSVYKADTSRLRAETASQSAVSSFNPMPGADNSLFKQAMGTLHAELESQGVDQHGLKGPELEQFIKDGIGATKASLVQHLIANEQTDSAERVLKSMQDGGELKAEVADHLRILIDSGKEKGSAIRAATAIAAEGGTVSEQEKRLYARFDRGDFGQGKRAGETYDMALQHLRADAAQKEHERTQANNQILGGILVQKLNNPNMTLAQLPAGVLARAKTDFQFGKAIDGMFTAPSTDPMVNAEAYYNVFSHIGDGTKYDLSTYPDEKVIPFRSALGAEVFDKKLVPLLASVRRHDANQPNTDPTKVDLPKVNEMVGQRLAPDLMKPKTPEDRARRGSVLQTVAESVRDAQVKAGRVFNQEELDREVNRAFLQQSPINSILNGPLSLLGMAPRSGTMLNMKVGDIPSEARKGMEAGFRARGITNPTDQMLLNQYWKTNGQQ